MEEIWKDIPEFEGYYQVSNLARIKSLARNISRNDGKDLPLKERVLVQIKSQTGYPCVSLSKSGTTKYTKVHRLVANAFIPNPENKRTINHKNGVKTDNRIENLEWCTHSENHTHAYGNGLMALKRRQWKSLISEDDMYFIKVLLNIGEKSKSIADRYGIPVSLVYSVKANRLWKYIQLEPSLVTT